MIKNNKINLIKEYILFNMTGTFIFVVCQLVYTILLVKLNTNYLKAFVISTFLSALMNFTLNSFFTFKSKELSKKKFLKILCIQFFEFMPNSTILIILIEVIKFPKILAPMICPVIMTPIMFFLSRKVLKSKKKSEDVDFKISL